MGMTVVLAGDPVNTSNKPGPGIVDGHVAICGELETKDGVIFVDSNPKRYVPAKGDLVIGVIEQKLADAWRVSLQPHSRSVRLGQFAFENSNRKNKPNLVKGDVVYARVSSATPAMEAEIEAFDGTTGKAAGFGQLFGGTLVSVRLGFARALLSGEHPILDAIGQRYSYEIAIGFNGRIWIKSPDSSVTLKIAHWLEKAQWTSKEEFTLYK